MGEEPDEAERAGSPGGLRSVVAEHPWTSASLLASVLLGAALSSYFVTEDLSLVRRLLGGAVFGGLGWLLVMVGRVI